MNSAAHTTSSSEWADNHSSPGLAVVNLRIRKRRMNDEDDGELCVGPPPHPISCAC